MMKLLVKNYEKVAKSKEEEKREPLKEKVINYQEPPAKEDGIAVIFKIAKVPMDFSRD